MGGSAARLLALFASAALASPAWAGPATTSFVEEFNSAAYRDPVATTASWDTALGELRFPPFAELVGGLDTPGSATTVEIVGSRAYVADGFEGIRIVDLSDATQPTLVGSYDTPDFTYDVTVVGTRAYVAEGFNLRILDIATPATPVQLGIVVLPGLARGVQVVGTHAFVAAGLAGLRVVDVANPAAPALVGGYDSPDYSYAVSVSGRIAFVADGTAGMLAIDITNPAAPALVSKVNTPGTAYGVLADGHLVHVADGAAGLHTFDATRPDLPVLLSTLDTPGTALGVAGSGPRIFVADWTAGVQAIDMTHPTTPQLLWSYDTPSGAGGLAVSAQHVVVTDDVNGLLVLRVRAFHSPVGFPLAALPTPDRALDIVVQGNRAFVADSAAGLLVYDVTDPVQPVLVGSLDTPGEARRVVVQGTFAYVADGAPGLQIVDVSHPTAPQLLATADTPGDCRSVAVEGTCAFVADGASGLRILDVSNPAGPVELSTFPTANAMAVAVSGGIAYVADGMAGLKIVNVADPGSPALMGSLVTSLETREVAAAGWCVALGEERHMTLVNVSQPAAPVAWTRVAIGDRGSAVRSVSFHGDLVIVSLSGGFDAVSVHDLTGRMVFKHFVTGARAHAMVGPLALIATEGGAIQTVEFQVDRFHPGLSQGQSLRVNAPIGADILCARVTPTATDPVRWMLLTATGGANWTGANAGTWTLLEPGEDLRWQVNIGSPAPCWNAQYPAMSSLRLDWLYRQPLVDAITDVPGDQGGWARLRFTASAFDLAPGTTTPATLYQIYRRVDDAALAARVEREFSRTDRDLAAGAASSGPGVVRMEGRSFAVGGATGASALPPGTWEAITYVAATQSERYTALVPTLGDSTASGPRWSAFLVTVHTTDPLVWHAGPVDSGYSVDNLVPNVPTGLTVTPLAGGNALDWSAPTDPDFRYHRIYRGTTSDFSIGPATLVHQTVRSSWLDAAGGPAWYKVTALDFAGNESAPAAANVVVDVPATPRVAVFALHAVAPNPLRGAARVRFDLPQPVADLELSVWDVGGRAVRTLARGPREPGAHEIAWDGRDGNGRALPPGVYHVRMQAGPFMATRRVVLLAR